MSLLHFYVLKDKSLSCVLRNAADMIEDYKLKQYPLTDDQLDTVFDELCRIEVKRKIKNEKIKD